MLWSLAFKFFWVTGGTDGIRVPRSSITLLGGLIDFKGPGAYQRFVYSYYYYVLVLFVVAVAIMWVIVHSPFGKALQAIRDNETRASFVGIRCGAIAGSPSSSPASSRGLPGALWVPLNGLTTPDILYWPFSGEIVFMTVLGGFRTFTGPDRRRDRVQLPQGLRGRELAILAAGAGRRAASSWCWCCRPASSAPSAASPAS